jgi:hypothetical protein
MRVSALTLLAVATGLALSACSITTPAPAPAVVQENPPVVMSPGTTTMVQPGSVIVQPR